MKDLAERGFEFSLAALSLPNKLQIAPEHRFLLNQFLRSACSIGANITEGRAGSSRKEMARYYQISLKSSRETIYWLKLLRAVSEKRQAEIDELLAEVSEITRILTKSILSLKSEIAKESPALYKTSTN